MKIKKEFQINDTIRFQKETRKVYELVSDLMIKYPGARFIVHAIHRCSDLRDEYGDYVSDEVIGPLVLFSKQRKSMIVRDNPFREHTDSYQGEWSTISPPGDIVTPEEMDREAMLRGEYLWIMDWEVEKIVMEFEPANNKEAAQSLIRLEEI